MSIRKHRTRAGWWQILISQGRHNPPVIIPFEGTEAEARAAERELRGIQATANSKVAELLPAYLEWYRINRLLSGYDELNYSLQRLLPHFGNIPAAYITARNLEAYKAARLQDTWHGKPTSRITINRELKHLMALLRWSAKQGTIPPVTIKPEYFSGAHCEREARPIHVLTPKEITDIFAALAATPTYVLHLLMYWSGLRMREATRITVRDIDLKSRTVRIQSKGGKIHIAAFPASIVPIVEQAMKGREPGNLLCPNPMTGFPYQDLRSPLETAARKAGITKRIHPHAFRHSHGTNLIKAGASLPEVQMSLRHADMSTTRRYIHLAAENATIQTDRLEQYSTPVGHSDTGKRKKRAQK